MSNTLLKVDNLHVYYGSIHAIKGISFEVNEGEIVTLIGANGAGKSTTLNTIAGLLKPHSGSIMLHDQNIVGVPADKIVSKGMALCPEGRRIFLQMTVLENLEMGGYTRPNSELEESIENVYDHFPRLKERYKQVAGTLSGGEQQMLAVGRALMSRPKIIMMDEPSLGLAPLHALVVCIIGNMIPIPFIIVYIRRIFQWMRRKSPKLNSLVDRLEAKAHLKGKKVTRYKYIGLWIFVAIPLPGTGAWTGALIAALLDMPLRKAVPSIFLGVVTAGLIMTLATGTVVAIFAP